MANDPPTSLKMDFGYAGARQAGVTNYRAPYDGQLMNFGLEEQHAETAIAALAKQYPSLKRRFSEIARQELGKKQFRFQDILFLMRCEVDDQRKAGKLK
jgi:oligoendopeptidase F